MPLPIIGKIKTVLNSLTRQFNSFVYCPLIIDSPRQQEQDNKNTDAIFEFIFSSVLDEQQLILGTVDYEDAEIDSKINVIELKTKHSLLSSEQYQDVYDEVAPLHKETLAVSE